jgi:hypothetical protein
MPAFTISTRSNPEAARESRHAYALTAPARFRCRRAAVMLCGCRIIPTTAASQIFRTRSEKVAISASVGTANSTADDADADDNNDDWPSERTVTRAGALRATADGERRTGETDPARSRQTESLSGDFRRRRRRRRVSAMKPNTPRNVCRPLRHTAHSVVLENNPDTLPRIRWPAGAISKIARWRGQGDAAGSGHPAALRHQPRRSGSQPAGRHGSAAARSDRRTRISPASWPSARSNGKCW